jgi:hypothetical protein
MGITISNNSWGGGGYSQSFYDAIEASQAVDHVFVAAAGNSAQNLDANLFYPAGYDLRNILSVAAMNSSDDLAYFSNYGAYRVDLGAPGKDVLSTIPGGEYDTKSGTSMAAPHVAGVVAIVYDLHPDWTWAQVIDQILSTARPLSALQGLVRTDGTLNGADAISNPDPIPFPTPGPTPTSSPRLSNAIYEWNVEGAVRGKLEYTWTQDGRVELVSERSSRGKPDSRLDALEHHWMFCPRGGRNRIFSANVWATDTEDNDQIVFEWSVDRTNWNPMFTVQNKAATTTYQEFHLPNSIEEPCFYVRVRDTDRTVPVFKTENEVYVDHMFLAANQ